MLRRIMRDEADLAPARVVFTFDGDAAGQKAAMRAFGEDQRWASQSFVAVEASGKDPCELRQAEGPDAVRALVDDAVPMFEFAVRTTIGRFDLDRAEGRIQALRAAAPIVAGIRDRSLRPEYARVLAGQLGVEVEQVTAEVARAGKAGGPAGRRPASPRGVGGVPGADRRRAADAIPRPDLRDPVVFVERQLLQVVLQFPSLLDPAAVDGSGRRRSAPPPTAPSGTGSWGRAAYRAGSAAAWTDAVVAAAPAAVHPLVAELAVAPLPVTVDRTTGLPSRRYRRRARHAAARGRADPPGRRRARAAAPPRQRAGPRPRRPPRAGHPPPGPAARAGGHPRHPGGPDAQPVPRPPRRRGPAATSPPP